MFLSILEDAEYNGASESVEISDSEISNENLKFHTDPECLDLYVKLNLQMKYKRIDGNTSLISKNTLKKISDLIKN